MVGRGTDGSPYRYLYSVDGVTNSASRYGAHLTAPASLDTVAEDVSCDPILSIAITQAQPGGYAVSVWRDDTRVRWALVPPGAPPSGFLNHRGTVGIPAPSVDTPDSLELGAVYSITHLQHNAARAVLGPRWWIYRVHGVSNPAATDGAAYIRVPFPLSAARLTWPR